MTKTYRLLTPLAFLLSILMVAPSKADCRKLLDPHMEYYQKAEGEVAFYEMLDHKPYPKTFRFTNHYNTNITRLPYDIKIIDDRSQQYSIVWRNIVFFYPNLNTLRVQLGFGDVLSALCIIETPDNTKWVVWRRYGYLAFFDEADDDPN